MTDLRVIVGENVRHTRSLRGVTQAELSARSGVSVRYLREIETGRANVSLSILEKLANALSTTAAELTTRQPTKS